MAGREAIPIEKHQNWSRELRLFIPPWGGITADEVIKRLAREGRERAVIVTADRDIEGYAERQTATVITPKIFCAKVEEAKISELKGDIKSKETDRVESTGDGLKEKGPARRTTSRIRKNIRKIKKLYLAAKK